MKKKEKIIVASTIICMILVVVIGLTYAYWSRTKTQTGVNVVETGCFDLSIISEENDIVLRKVFPISDEAGLELIPYTFTIKNTCEITASYNVILDILPSEDRLALSSVKASLKGRGILAPTKLSHLENAELASGALEGTVSKKLYNGALGQNEEASFELRLWIASDAPQTEMRKNISSKIRIEGTPTDTCEVSANDTTPGVIAGSGTEADPYLIESIEDLVALSQISYSNVPTDKYYELTTDLDFQCPNSYMDSTTTVYGDINGNDEVEDLMTELTTGAGFKPISVFNNNLDGNNHTINNLFINRSYDYRVNVGLISEVKGHNVTLKNINLTNANVTSSNGETGILVGYTQGSTSSDIYPTFDNISVSGNVSSDRTVGGIVGQAYTAKVLNCTNNATVNGSNAYTGGVVGDAYYYTTIENCVNYGDVSTTGSGVAGIAGYGNSATILNSYNYGNISGGNTSAGILPDTSQTNTIKNCGNNGNISGREKVAGIVGSMVGSISNCYNTGRITIENNSTSSTFYVGGIVAFQNSGVGIKNVYSTGEIVDNADQSSFSNWDKIYTGCLTGYQYVSIENFYSVCNMTSINSKNYSSGISGNTSSSLSKNGYVKFNVSSPGNITGGTFYGPNITNYYVDMNVNGTPTAVDSILSSTYTVTGTAYYRITGTDTYTETPNTTPYTFNNVNSTWFSDTLELGTSWKYEDGYYPLLYKLDADGNPTTELLEGQVKKSIN